MYNAEHEESGNEWESQLLEEEMVKHGSIVKVREDLFLKIPTQHADFNYPLSAQCENRSSLTV